MKLLLVSALLLATAANAADLQYKSDGHLSQVMDEVVRLLPPNYLKSATGTVSVEEVPLPSDELFQSEDLCQINEGVKFGLTKKNKIFISSRLVQLSRTISTRFNCGHGTFREMLKAVILHELTHVKDNAERISSDPNFQRIVGMKKITRNSRKKPLSQNTTTSPDAYEFESLEESLAVNTEYLALDPEFECRKPATAAFLSRRLGFALRGQCQKNYNLIAQSAYLEDNYQLAVSIEPQRIYQIHYLFAGKGRQLMSRWGHAMFRLVVCAPHRKTPGPECLEDVSHHLALSYRAYMNEINISYAKGVAGGYPSQLFVLRYLEVQQEYTKQELRDLFSIPLKLSSRQKEDFLDLTLERYWTYQGRYYFLDNNCGTETVKHLGVALSEEDNNLISSITPLSIYRDIIRSSNDLTDERIEGLSRQELVNKRLLAESMFSGLNESYQVLRSYLPSFSQKSMEKFLKKTSAEVRFADYDSFINASSAMDPILRKQVAMKMIHFERYLAGRFLTDVPKKALEKMSKDPELKAEVLKMGDSLKLLALQPWQVIDSRYGAPTASEFDFQFPRFLKHRQAQMRSSIEGQLMNLQNILGKKQFAAELSELDELKKIKKLLADFLTVLSEIR